MMPATLHATIIKENAAVFDTFIDFPKPIIAAVNGPAIGAVVTSATLCDAILASDKATFSTPFGALKIVSEGCSSVHFARIMGEVNAERMLGDEGWRPTAEQAKEAGFVDEVVKEEQVRFFKFWYSVLHDNRKNIFMILL
jgi:peroxisomal 3,2-trans-enoyl-CoA isomerase